MQDSGLVGRFTSELFQILEETFECVHGIFLDRGTSLFETLDGVSADVASRPIAGGPVNIAAHVDHVRLYLSVLEAHMLGRDIGKVDWEEIWRNSHPVDEDEWDSLKRRLREQHAAVVAVMRGFQAWDGENEIAGALAILAHTAYHVGGIRQALNAVTAQ